MSRCPLLATAALSVASFLCLSVASRSAPQAAQDPCQDGDHDGLGDSLEQYLAERFAPVILIEPHESNYPVRVEWYLERTGLAFHEDCTDDVEEVLLTTVGTQERLVGPPWAHPDHFGAGHPERHCGESPHHRRLTTIAADPDGEGATGYSDQMTFYLDSVAEEDRVGDLDPRGWPTYFHAYPTAGGGVMLQYWHVFTYNQFAGVFGSHDGDWDANLMVELDASLAVLGVWAPRHTDEHPGPFFPAAQVQFYGGTHPIMAIDGGGHAAFVSPQDWCQYNTGGFNMGTVVFGDPDDPAGLRRVDACFPVPMLSDPAGGTVWKAWSAGDVRQAGEVTHVLSPNPSPHGGLVNVGEYNPCTPETCQGIAQATTFLAGEFRPLNGQQFIRYSGRWGKTDLVLKEPRGPVFQGLHEGVYTAWYNQGAEHPPYPGLVLTSDDRIAHSLAGDTWDGHGGPLASQPRPYLLCGAVQIPAGRTLSISPGTTLLVPPGTSLRAAGTALVDGREAPVRFVAGGNEQRGLTVRGLLRLSRGGTLRLP